MLNLADINILKGVNPIKLVSKPSVKTLEFLNKLKNDKNIASYIIQKRTVFKIPSSGNDISKLVGLSLNDIGDTNLKAILLVANDFTKSTGLPQEYVLQIALLVLFNAIIDLRYFKHEPSEPHEFVFGRQKIFNKMWDYDHEVGAIIIPFNISKTKLKKWIDTHWDAITADMDNHFTTNPFMLGVHENLLLEEEINRLKHAENKSFTEILEIFKQKYPKDNWKLSRITKIYYDAKQRNNLATAVK